MATVRSLDSSPVTSLSRSGYTMDASDAVEGTLLIVAIVCRETERVSQVPADWTIFEEIVGYDSNGNDASLYVYTKIAEASETSYIWSMNRSTYGGAGLIEVADVENSILVHEIALEEDPIPSRLLPVVDVAVAGSVAIVLAGAVEDNNTELFIPPASYDQIIDTSTSRRAALGVAWREYDSVGQTDPAAEYAQAEGNNVAWAMAHIVLVPAGSIVITPPDTPSNLTVSAGLASLQMEWDDNTESDLHTTEPYEYRVATIPDMSDAGLPVAVDINEVLIEGLVAGETYWCQVRAKNSSDMTSGWTQAQSAIIPLNTSNSGQWGMDIGLG